MVVAIVVVAIVVGVGGIVGMVGVVGSGTVDRVGSVGVVSNKPISLNLQMNGNSSLQSHLLALQSPDAWRTRQPSFGGLFVSQFSQSQETSGSVQKW